MSVSATHKEIVSLSRQGKKSFYMCLMSLCVRQSGSEVKKMGVIKKLVHG